MNFILEKLGLNKKENKEDIHTHIEKMNSNELMECIQESKRLIKRLENKDGGLYDDLNICYCDYKSKSNFLNGDTVEKIDPWLEAMLKEVAIEYHNYVIKEASERLKEVL